MEMTPEQARILQQVALSSLENETKITQRVVEAIPVDKGHYKHDPASMDSWTLAKHITNSELQILRGSIEGKFEFGSGVPESVKTPADLSKWYAAESGKIADEIRALPPEKLSRIVDFMGFMKMPAVLFISFAMNHTIHHRGQLSTHLRAAGGKVPSIYGPSHDTEQAEKAAGAH